MAYGQHVHQFPPKLLLTRTISNNPRFLREKNMYFKVENKKINLKYRDPKDYPLPILEGKHQSPISMDKLIPKYKMAN